MRIQLRVLGRRILVTLIGFLLAYSSAFAQSGGSTEARFGGSFQGSVSLTGLGPILLECIAKEVGGNFLNSINPFNSGDDVADTAIDVISGDSDFPGGGLLSQSVPVNNSKLEKEAKDIKEEAEAIKKEEEKATRKERCEDKIARFIALQAMDRITFSTLEWINSGFEGKPFYVENPAQFFTDLATQELLGFSADFSDPELYPFGQLLIRTVFSSFQRSFEQNMINSLNNVLAHGTYNQWTADFSVGGWAGYTAYVEPNNNIFGAYIESARNIQRNIQGTRIPVAIDAQRQLDQGLGFLSQRECAVTESGGGPGSYIPADDPRHLKSALPRITSVNQIPNNVLDYISDCDNGDCENIPEDQVAQAEIYRGRSVCAQWRTLTPGNQIAQQVTKAIGISQDQALLADELNENIGLIFDALLNQLITQGLQSFNGATEDNVAWAQINNLNPGNQAVNTVDFTGVVNGYSENGEEIVGIIPAQETYLNLVQNLILLRQFAAQRIYDLDYCVPGPNPLWRGISSSAVGEYLNNTPVYVDPISANPPYIARINAILGVSADPDDVVPMISNYTEFFTIIGSEIFLGYADIISERFSPQNQDFNNNLRQQAFEYFLDVESIVESNSDLQQIATETQGIIAELVGLREEYAQMEYVAILQELQNLVGTGNNPDLADNLATFQSFTPSQVTYIGQGGQNSSYNNAVLTLASELGSYITPPQNDPAYTSFLDDFASVLDAGNVATQASIQSIQGQIQETQEIIGSASDPESVTGLIISCVGQVNSQSFDGYTERVPYPLPISQDLGLQSLPTTSSFVEDMIASFNPNPRSFSIIPEDSNQNTSTEYSDNLEALEDFMNSGGSLY